MTDLVLDNSITMRWCFDSGAHERADKILGQLERQSTAFVLILWRYEVSAVLFRAQNRGFLEAHKAGAFLEDLAALSIVVDTIPVIVTRRTYHIEPSPGDVLMIASEALPGAG